MQNYLWQLKNFDSLNSWEQYFNELIGKSECPKWALSLGTSEANVNQKTAIVSGVLGQTGSYLAERLIKDDVKVYGLCRPRTAGLITNNISNIIGNSNLELIEADICDHVQLSALIQSLTPSYFFNLAAQSHVGVSFEQPTQTFKVNAEAVIAQLHAIKKFSPSTRYYQASTSEILGTTDVPVLGYTEDSPFHPRSPYGVAKLAAYYSVINYREAYNIFACNGVLFNHSSPRRGITFATRKITQGIAEVKMGKRTTVKMGDLSARRDEGHAKDYVEAMYKMLQADTPKDYLISTGVTTSIKEMFEYVCELAQVRFEDVYSMDERYIRPSDIPILLGDSSMAREELGWEPKYTWKELLKEMYESDLKLLEAQNDKPSI